MTSISHVAEELTQRFFQAGFFPAGTGAMDSSATPIASNSESASFQDIIGFSGLPIQCMGYTQEEIKIYATRVSSKKQKSIPEEIKGYPISVNKLGNFYVRPEISKHSAINGHAFQKDNRFCCGSSAAPSSVSYAGTFGAIVKDETGKYFALSNNHIFGDCNHMPVDMPIMMPSSIDARPGKPSPEAICFHSRISELRSGVPSLVTHSSIDAAIAEIKNIDRVSSWQGTPDFGYDTPSAVMKPESEMRVKKFGRTTGMTTGVIESRITLLSLDYKSKKFSATVWLKDIWIIHGDEANFALPGDSGSLVVSEDGTGAIGLLFASTNNGEYAWMYPLNEVFKCLSVDQLVSGHNV